VKDYGVVARYKLYSRPVDEEPQPQIEGDRHDPQGTAKRKNNALHWFSVPPVPLFKLWRWQHGLELRFSFFIRFDRVLCTRPLENRIYKKQNVIVGFWYREFIGREYLLDKVSSTAIQLGEAFLEAAVLAIEILPVALVPQVSV